MSSWEETMNNSNHFLSCLPQYRRLRRLGRVIEKTNLPAFYPGCLLFTVAAIFVSL